MCSLRNIALGQMKKKRRLINTNLKILKLLLEYIGDRFDVNFVEINEKRVNCL